MKIHNRRELLRKRKKLRNKGTSAEARLWTLIKNKQLDGYKFRRQHSIGNYIADFYCPAGKLVIELDGHHHFTEEGLAHDQKRSAYFQSLGIATIRFENHLVFDHPEAVLDTIKNRLESSAFSQIQKIH